MKRRLETFFECIPYSHRYYRPSVIGALRLAFSPWLVALAIIAALGTWWAIGRTSSNTFLQAAASSSTLLLGLGAANWIARARLGEEVEALAHFYGEEVRGTSDPPHLVAHSLGTYLSGNALSTFDTVRFRRVVLCAAVLPRDYNWSTILERAQVEHVRSEVGLRDAVPTIARWVAPLVPGLGDAGKSGFLEHDPIVHTVNDQVAPCRWCSGYLAPVHNYVLPFRHSASFIGNLQCEVHWLPFLLGYDQTEYARLLALCRDISEADRSGFTEHRDELEIELRQIRWKWLQGKTLEEYILPLMRRHFRTITGGIVYLLEPYVLHALGLFWRQIAAAQLERAKGLEQDRWVVAALDPLTVLLRATNAAGES